jgi:hypothetical protein
MTFLSHSLFFAFFADLPALALNPLNAKGRMWQLPSLTQTGENA